MSEEISKNVLKTGTLTLGIVCKEGIILAADNRVSYGGAGGGVAYLAGKLKKILSLNERMLVTMAGTASDAERLVKIIRAELRLKELKTKDSASVEEVANLVANLQFSNIRQFSVIPSIAHFVLAGFDSSGYHLYEISPDGHMRKVEGYVASGAGIMQAHPILDSEYVQNMSLDDGIALAKKCILSSMKREPSVGDGFDIYVIKKNEVKQLEAKEALLEFKDKK